MISGVFRNPTTIFFGLGAESVIGDEISKHARKVLVHFGTASYGNFGLRERINSLLSNSGIEIIELGGVSAGPETGLVYEGINLCRREHIDFILAVGGGSVIDSAKAIAVGVPYAGDFMDFFEKRAQPATGIKVGVVLTICGAGSESSEGAVLTHTITRRKLECVSPFMFPLFAVLNPDIPRTVSMRNSAFGIVDAISHVFERYFTNTFYVELTDRICEGLLLTLMKYALVMQEEPGNLEVRAEIMWACKMAHDSTPGFGRKQDWACHKIAHEIEIRCGASHGAILAVIFPAWMDLVQHEKAPRFLQLAKRVFDVDVDHMPSAEATAEAISRYRAFLSKLGTPSTLRALGMKDESHYSDIAQCCSRTTQSGTIGNFMRLSTADIEWILAKAH